MSLPQLVMDTNVLVSALRSQYGASYMFLMLLEQEKYELNLSVPLAIEYEAVAKRLIGQITLNNREIENILDYVCSVAHHQQVFYLWRPFLKDPKDDMILELAVAAGCEIIVTYDKDNFHGVEQFGIRALTPKEFLQEIGALS